MLTDNKTFWKMLERWVAATFFIAALAGSGSEVVHHLEVAGVMTTPTWVSALLTNLTYGAAMVGLLGLYPRVVDEARRLGRAGLVAIGVVVVSLLAATVGRAVFGPEGPVIIMLVVSIAFYSSTTISFLLFGVACTRIPSFSRTLGVPLLVVALARVLVFVGGVLEFTGLRVVGAVLFILPLLIVAYFMWAGSVPARASQMSPAAR